jgi:hypothetical protein
MHSVVGGIILLSQGRMIFIDVAQFSQQRFVRAPKYT